jgi:hypothetical protein
MIVFLPSDNVAQYLSVLEEYVLFLVRQWLFFGIYSGRLPRHPQPAQIPQSECPLSATSGHSLTIINDEGAGADHL